MKLAAAIDLYEGNVVRLVKGQRENKILYSTDPVATAIKWETAGADMLHVVDLDAAFQKGTNLQIITRILSAVNIPVQVAGGIRLPAQVEEVFSKNADRVVLGTLAYSDTDATKKLAKKYPARIVVSLDQKENQVMVKGWTESTGVTIHDAVSRFRSAGISEFLLTSIDRDGTLLGPDVHTLSKTATSGAKIIASGGISCVEDIIRVKNAGCSSVILGKALYDNLIGIDRARMVA